VELNNIKSLKIINLPKIVDFRGSLSFFECDTHLNFNKLEVSWHSKISSSTIKKICNSSNEELFVALSGSLDINLLKKSISNQFNLTCPSTALYVPKGFTIELKNCSENLVLLIASSKY
jgi:hypothetical protein